MKKAFKIVGWVMLGLVAMAFVYYTWIYFQIKNGELIKWEGQWYAKEDLQKKYGPQYYEAPAKNNPEEVYAEYRGALLRGDTEAALKLMTPKRREEYRKAFEDKEKFDKWVKSLPEKIKKDSEDGNFSYYDVDYGTEYKNSASFIKNQEGYWQIDAI